jgi:hypothetical protein
MSNFPVDEQALKLLKEALNTAYEVDEEGNHTLVGGDFSLYQLLEFYSGYDPKKLEQINDAIAIYPDPVYSLRDVIEALVDEVLRLRGCAPEEALLD